MYNIILATVCFYLLISLVYFLHLTDTPSFNKDNFQVKWWQWVLIAPILLLLRVFDRLLRLL